MAIPLCLPDHLGESLSTASRKHFDFCSGQRRCVGHTLLLDDIRIENDAPLHQAAPPAPTHVQAKGYERHIDITWSPVEYEVWRNMSSIARSAANRSGPSASSARVPIVSAITPEILT